MKVSTVKEWFYDWRASLTMESWRAYFAEFLGTFLFVLISSLVVFIESLYQSVGALGIALAVGLTYTALVYVTAHLSGGYLNPAVTVALWLAQRLSGVKAIFFLLSQILASFIAAWTLLFLFGDLGIKHALGTPTLGLNVTLTTAVILEAIFSAGLIFAVFGTMVDRHGPVSFGPLVIGLYLVAASIALLPISGAVFNPARVFGPAIVSASVDTLAVWIIGPLTGSLFAIVYEVVFLKKVRK